MWIYRERLNYHEKLRRSLYEILRDVLEQRLMKISLVDSYYKHIESGAEYSFVDKSELKPKSKKVEKESDLFRTFIVIFCEGTIQPELKNYIRFFPENKVIKENIEFFAELPLYKNFDRNLRYFDKPRFLDFLETWLDVDYALLIQQDPTVRRNNRYALTHFHVKIDWPIADAAEDLSRWLRYIQSHLYEKGDSDGRYLQRKLFEYYGCHVNVGGRRTAALIAAQLVKRLDFITTVFVSSSESRSMIKYSERGLSKFFLIQLTEKQILALANREFMDPESFKSAYLYPARDVYLGISEAVYGHTVHAKPPEDGKLRRFKPHVSWVRLKDEFLHPKETFLDLRPINYRWVYASD